MITSRGTFRLVPMTKLSIRLVTDRVDIYYAKLIP